MTFPDRWMDTPCFHNFSISEVVNAVPFFNSDVYMLKPHNQKTDSRCFFGILIVFSVSIFVPTTNFEISAVSQKVRSFIVITNELISSSQEATIIQCISQ